MTRDARRSSSRRRLLAALASAGSVGLAGCGRTADPDGSTPAPTDTPAGTTDGPTKPGPTEPGPTETPTTTADGTTTAPTDEELRAVARTFVERLGAGEFAAATDRFAPGLAAQVDAAALEGIWADLRRQRGAYVGVEGTRPTTANGFRAVVVTTTFSGGRQGIRVVFDEAARVVGFQFVPAGGREWTPPDYVDPGAFETTDLTVDGPGDCGLPAELVVPRTGDGDEETTPDEAPARPGVVVLGGSGPTDLDGSLGPNRPYRDLAYGLGSRAVSSLRYSKRTAACEVDPATLTIDEEYTTDALAATARLRAESAADGVVVLGHSLGAKLAPRVADRASGVVGVAMLAPPARPLADLVVEQTRYLADLDGTVTDTERARIESVEAAAERVRSLDLSPGETVLGGGRAYWESLQAYDALATARSLSVPVLLARGRRDYQVSSEDLDRWASALSGEPNVRVERYEGLNHLFVPGEGPSSPAEYQRPGHVARRVIADLATWVRDLPAGPSP